MIVSSYIGVMLVGLIIFELNGVLVFYGYCCQECLGGIIKILVVIECIQIFGVGDIFYIGVDCQMFG